MDKGRAHEVRPPDPNSPRAAAVYLLALRPMLGTISGGRRALVRSLRDLAEDARRGGPLVRERALTIGNERLAFFQEARRQFEAIAPPPPGRAIHAGLAQWFDRMMAACNGVVTFGITGQVADLRRAGRYLEEAATHAHEFNEEHRRLVALMRGLVEDRRFRRRMVAR
ncbi:MAG TPA: hypothetical protein VG370_32515 [Chloroflexota bacterium]|nr:hypothetical protein [Chloroflexota bacterium]